MAKLDQAHSGAYPDSHAPTLATSGSVNTQMGITRIIREKLKREHQYFIVEMSVWNWLHSAIVRSDSPNAATVTAVGVAHYERFKSLETVTQAKSELPARYRRTVSLYSMVMIPIAGRWRSKSPARIPLWAE